MVLLDFQSSFWNFSIKIPDPFVDLVLFAVVLGTSCMSSGVHEDLISIDGSADISWMFH